MGLNPREKGLVQGGFGEGGSYWYPGRPQRDKLPGFLRLRGPGWEWLGRHNRRRVFPGPVFLAETDIQIFAPLTVELTELAVLVSVGVWLVYIRARGASGLRLSSCVPGEDTPGAASDVFPWGISA